MAGLALTAFAIFMTLVGTGSLARAEDEVSPPALLRRASVTVADGVVLFQPGLLVVGDPTLPGRPAVRPLEDSQLAVIPEQLDEFVILSAGCIPEQVEQDHQPAVIGGGVLARGDMGGDGRLEQVRVRRRAPMAAPEVLVSRDGALVGKGELPVPAVPCRGLIAEAEPQGSPVLLIVWTSRGAGATTVGVTVFELDEPATAAD